MKKSYVLFLFLAITLPLCAMETEKQHGKAEEVELEEVVIEKTIDDTINDFINEIEFTDLRVAERVTNAYKAMPEKYCTASIARVRKYAHKLEQQNIEDFKERAQALAMYEGMKGASKTVTYLKTQHEKALTSKEDELTSMEADRNKYKKRTKYYPLVRCCAATGWIFLASFVVAVVTNGNCFQ